MFEISENLTNKTRHATFPNPPFLGTPGTFPRIFPELKFLHLGLLYISTSACSWKEPDDFFLKTHRQRFQLKDLRCLKHGTE